MEFRSLPGITDYVQAHALQLELVEKRIRDEIPDTILFLEHAPVITRGRGLQIRSGGTVGPNGGAEPKARAMPLMPALLPPGIAYAEIERGGDLTYHGPGQLVVYPICKLDGSTALTRAHDLGHFLRALETMTMKVLSPELEPLGYQMAQVEDATGVWLSGPANSDAASGAIPRQEKIASLGIAVRRWVTFHGLAVNLVNDLKPFALMSPCGFAPDVMTSWAKCIAKVRGADAGANLERSDWRTLFEGRFRAEFLG